MLFTTHADLGEVPAERSWGALRALRADPPGLASRTDRRPVFTAALEQAEQLFRAAAAVGVATQPLLAFYGLSQAGRAITAALAEDKWILSAHGIGSDPDVGATSDQLANLRVTPRAKGSFGRVREVLGSSSLSAGTRIGELWPLLAETAPHPLHGSGEDRSLTIGVDVAGWGSGIFTVQVQGLPDYFADVGAEHLAMPSGLGANYTAQAEALDDYLSRYPTLTDRLAITAAGQPIGLQPQGDGTCSVNFRWPDEVVARYRDIDAFYSEVAVQTRARQRVYPSLDGGNRPVHPLVVWWALLFRLSMLARYEPEGWAAITEVNSSADAVPVEHLLGCALSSVPELIHGALTLTG